MPWYKLTRKNKASTQRKIYRYLSDGLDDDEVKESLREEWYDWVGSSYGITTGDYEELDALPAKAVVLLREEYERQAERAVNMLRILDNTPIRESA